MCITCSYSYLVLDAVKGSIRYDAWRGDLGYWEQEAPLLPASTLALSAIQLDDIMAETLFNNTYTE